MNKKIDKLVDYINKNDVVTTNEIVAAGFSKSTLKDAVKQNLIVNWERGVYSSLSSTPDEYYLVQQRSKYLIFSNETALYLHNLTDVHSVKYSVTIPKGYNYSYQQNIKIYSQTKQIYETGIIEMKSPGGAILKVYDLDKTIVDVIKNENKIDSQIFVQALHYYVIDDRRNISKALKYADILKIRSKVLTYLKIVQEG